MSYIDCAYVAEHYGEKNDCAIKAVSIATDTLYTDVREVYKQMGRKPRSRTGGGISWEMFRECMQVCSNNKAVEVTKDYNSKTLRTFEREALVNKVFIVEVRGHVSAVKYGVVEDWAQGSCMRINKIWEIQK